jgi:hypothetical protein
MDKLSTGDKLLAGGGIVLFVLSFIGSWAEIAGPIGDVLGENKSLNAWDGYAFFPLELGFIVALVVIGWILATVGGVEIPEIPSATYAGAGGLVLLLILLGLVMGPHEVPLFDSRGPIIFIAIIPAGTMAAGGYLKMQEQTVAGPATRPPTTPPPPPVA